MRYPVDRTSDDGLSQTRWEFETIQRYHHEAPRLVIWFYGTGTRKTRRHKWEWAAAYRRGNRNLSNVAQASVPLPDDVKAEALSLFMDSVVVEV
jgi:hypothetical protein